MGEQAWEAGAADSALEQLQLCNWVQLQEVYKSAHISNEAVLQMHAVQVPEPQQIHYVAVYSNLLQLKYAYLIQIKLNFLIQGEYL